MEIYSEFASPKRRAYCLRGGNRKDVLTNLVTGEDTHVHRYLWRNLELTKKPTIYALKRVTFGDKPSPDMASFVMLKMAKDNEKDNPHAAAILRRDRYMDDSIHSCPTTKEAVQRIKELDRVLDTGSFKIKEWISSSEIVLNDLSQVSLRNLMKKNLSKAQLYRLLSI